MAAIKEADVKAIVGSKQVVLIHLLGTSMGMQQVRESKKQPVYGYGEREGLGDFIDYCTSQGVQVGVVSLSHQQRPAFLDGTNLEGAAFFGADYLDATRGHDVMDYGAMAKALDTSLDATLVIGDDVRAAPSRRIWSEQVDNMTVRNYGEERANAAAAKFHTGLPEVHPFSFSSLVQHVSDN